MSDRKITELRAPYRDALSELLASYLIWYETGFTFGIHEATPENQERYRKMAARMLGALYSEYAND